MYLTGDLYPEHIGSIIKQTGVVRNGPKANKDFAKHVASFSTVASYRGHAE